MPEVFKIRKPAEQSFKKVHDPFYDTPAWRTLSRAHRTANPMCEYCIEKGYYVNGYATDHNLPRKIYPELSLTPTNMATICPGCDGKKRNIEAKTQDREVIKRLLREGGFYLSRGWADNRLADK
ncbi:MAG TPA: HNH endonuclease [Chryseosolibacter sp.]|nr:HNH endonuclease [Chryseosolibacter sp.]